MSKNTPIPPPHSQSEWICRALAAVFGLLDSTDNLQDLMRRIGALLGDWSGCEAVGVRFTEGDDFPYFETRGFSPEFVLAECGLCLRDAEGRAIRGADGRSVLECMCGTVLSGRCDPVQPFFTEGGSFWTNNLSRLLATTTEAEWHCHTRNRCHREGYESVALIPMRFRGRTFGLLQLNDRREDRFSPEMIRFLETIGSSLAVGLSNRQEAEAARASERRWQFALEGAGDGIWDWNVDTGQVYYSSQWKAMLGYADHEIGDTVDEWDRRVHPDDRQRVYAELNGHLDGHLPTYSSEHRLLCKDGSYKWILDRGKVISRDGGGRPLRAIGTLTDITQHRELEARLSFQAMVLDQIGDQVTATDLDGRITYVNAAECRMLGWSREDLIGRPIESYGDHPDIGATQREIIATTRSAGQWSGEVVNRCRDGSEVVMACRTWLLRDRAGQPVGMCGVGMDVTERRRAELALRESNERYRRITQAVTDYIYTVHVEDGRPVRTDHGYGCEAVTGYTAGAFAGDPFLWILMVHPDDRELVKRQAEAILASGRAEPIEHRIWRRDGSLRWVLNTPVAHLDPEGRLRSYDGLIRDITDRKRAELALEESRRQLAEAMDLALLAHWEYDYAAGRFLFNDRFYALYASDARREGGYTLTAEEFARRFFLPEDAHIVADHLARGLARTDPGASWTLEHRILRRDGEMRHVSVSISPVPDTAGGTVKLRGATQDITDRKRAEQALRDSEERFRTLAAAAFEGIAISENGVFVDVNEQLARMLGYRPAELIGVPVERVIAPEDRDRVLDNIRGRRESVLEHDMICKDGQHRAVEVHGRSMEYQGREVRITAFHDLTDRRRIAEERAELEAQVLQAKKLEAVGQLAGGVAHDFNNLLTVISGHAELAQEMVAADHPIRASLTTVLEAARQATGVTRSLLTFSRGLETDRENVLVDELIDETCRFLRRLLPQSVKLAVDAPRDPPLWLVTDRVQMGQVILNLAINARDAMPSGGELRIACRPVPAKEDGGQGPAEVCIEVSDTGVGIPPQNLDRLFEPFFSTKPRGQGTGLGLAIVHGIVQSLGGRVEVRSEVGQGSSFSVFLPCRGADETSSGNAAPRGLPQGRGETLLLADDDAEVLRLLTGALESLNYVVLQACDGIAMCDAWHRERRRIGAIITDVDMPRRTGLDALLRIRQDGGEVPAILITGAVRSEYSQHLDARMRVLHKPFQMADLADEVRRLLDANQPHQS